LFVLKASDVGAELFDEAALLADHVVELGIGAFLLGQCALQVVHLVLVVGDLLVAFAAVILARTGKVVNEDALWDAPSDAVTFDIGEREADPPVSPAVTPETDSPSSNGGESPSQTSESQENGQSPTGRPVSLMSVTSGPATSAS